MGVSKKRFKKFCEVQEISHKESSLRWYEQYTCTVHRYLVRVRVPVHGVTSNFMMSNIIKRVHVHNTRALNESTC